MKKSILIIFSIIVIVILVFVFYEKDEVKLLFVGDMNFDRYMREVMVEKGEDFAFACIASTLQNMDLVVGNLEGPITDNKSVSVGTEVGSPPNYVFTFPPTTASLLKRYNVKLVNIGNNHAFDFGKGGVVSTRKYLEEAGVDYFGGLKGDEPIFRTKIGGENISFISYNQFGGASPEKVAEKIREENEAGRLIIVYSHWGEEYGPVTAHQRNTAKLFAEAGAEAIIGSHPHVISPSEKIHSSSSGQVGETIVYYSLGNFIFDQYWNPEVRTGLMLELRIKDGQIETFEQKVVMARDGSTCPITN